MHVFRALKGLFCPSAVLNVDSRWLPLRLDTASWAGLRASGLPGMQPGHRGLAMSSPWPAGVVHWAPGVASPRARRSMPWMAVVWAWPARASWPREAKMLSFPWPCDRLVAQCKHRIARLPAQVILSFVYRSTDRYRYTIRLILVTSSQEEHIREKRHPFCSLGVRENNLHSDL
jgi:hypothetical protein